MRATATPQFLRKVAADSFYRVRLVRGRDYLGRATGNLHRGLAIRLGEDPVHIRLKGGNLLLQGRHLRRQVQGVHKVNLILAAERVRQCGEGVWIRLHILAQLGLKEALQLCVHLPLGRLILRAGLLELRLHRLQKPPLILNGRLVLNCLCDRALPLGHLHPRRRIGEDNGPLNGVSPLHQVHIGLILCLRPTLQLLCVHAIGLRAHIAPAQMLQVGGDALVQHLQLGEALRNAHLLGV